MKIVVTASGETLDSPVDQRFGRASKFIVYDSVTKELKTVDNSQSREAAQGAGIQAAETVSRLGAECLLTGHCGPKAFRALSAAGIRVYNGATGTVAQAIASFEAGSLPQAASADVDGHW
jgi:predicted Fe-Mo cluster-binding NifX family protein